MEINRHLFAAYLGMIKSGYDLMDMNDPIVIFVCNQLASFEFDSEILDYFQYAKTNRIRVNPYYPRGSDLSAACFFLQHPFEEYIAFLRGCESLDTDDPQFLAWIQKLPDILQQIENHVAFPPLWYDYEDMVTNRFSTTDKQIAHLNQYLSASSFASDTRIVFAPHLLQSKFLADFALVRQTLYVITGNFSISSAIHEYLHTALKPHRPQLAEILRRIPLSSFVDMDAMRALGYLHGDSAEHLGHTLEECLVRSITGILDEASNTERYRSMNHESGFISVSTMMERLASLPWSSMTLPDIIEQITSFI